MESHSRHTASRSNMASMIATMDSNSSFHLDSCFSVAYWFLGQSRLRKFFRGGLKFEAKMLYMKRRAVISPFGIYNSRNFLQNFLFKSPTLPKAKGEANEVMRFTCISFITYTLMEEQIFQHETPLSQFTVHDSRSWRCHPVSDNNVQKHLPR